MNRREETVTTEPEVWHFKVHPSTNFQIKVMSVLVQLFEHLDEAETRQVLRWAADRYGGQNGSFPSRLLCPTCNAPTDAFDNCLGTCAGEEWE